MFLALNTDMSCSLIKLDEGADRSLGLSIEACTDFSSAAKLSAKIKKEEHIAAAELHWLPAPDRSDCKIVPNCRGYD